MNQREVVHPSQLIAGVRSNLREYREGDDMVPDMTTEPVDLKAVLGPVERERSAIAGGNTAEYFAILTDGAQFMPPNSVMKSGAELRTWLSDFTRDFRVEWLAFSTVDVAAVGSLAYHAFTYTWRVTPRPGGEARVTSGKGIHILRRQDDGSWRITREIWNGTPS